MKNPVYLALMHTDGTTRSIIIEPVLKHNLADTGVYKIYKTSIDNESTLFTEELEIDETQASLTDSDNPDYLGTIIFLPNHTHWDYNGDLLSKTEQQQIATFLQQQV
ncbi:hypothetical protein [Mucilaginibacter flavus]|uniref:hypothetical protein n=1 Tax=Mucilaginibacter flavus TaxID=931504 RepID=UPI0025B444EA|nr:hypothetical protein [Mucilaginibacter flavus]MDN3582665.1 hypothetical protein [Mucilaginibacter flavus]